MKLPNEGKGKTMMKYRREMNAEQHMMVLQDKGEIRIKGKTIIVYTDEDGEATQAVNDYMVYAMRKGYKVIYR